MDNKERFNITFNIYGGSNQFLPNATTATQNFYDDRSEQDEANVERNGDRILSPEAARLSVYINNVEELPVYLAQIAECTNAVELAKTIVNMAEREPKITSEEIVKKKFISLFLPLTPEFISGKTIDNIRARINLAWAKRPKKRTPNLLEPVESMNKK